MTLLRSQSDFATPVSVNENTVIHFYGPMYVFVKTGACYRSRVSHFYVPFLHILNMIVENAVNAFFFVMSKNNDTRHLS